MDQKLVSHWPFPAQNSYELGDSHVHVWLASLDASPGRMVPFQKTLSNDERNRADSYHKEFDRRRFIVGRGLLRALLGLYLDVKPERLRFEYSELGKPFISFPRGMAPLQFSISHSRALILIALTPLWRIGVDLEWIHPFDGMARVAGQIASDRELLQLKELPQPQQLSAFFALLTRKEAYSKAIGIGLSEKLKAVSVFRVPNVSRLKILGDLNVLEDWTFVDLQPAPGYKGALAVRAEAPRVTWWQYPEAA